MAWVSENTARQLGAMLEGSGLAAFWRWWSGELLAVAPPWLRGLLRPARASLALQIASGEYRLHDLTDETWTEIARWPGAESDAKELPASAAAALAGRERSALVVLPEQDVLRRKIEVPAALAENLREAIGFELDRYTPYKPDQAYFDTLVLARDDSRQRLTIEIGVVPKERAERALARATGLGFAAAGLFAELPQGTANALDFLPAERLVRRGSPDRWAMLLPMSAVAILTLAALILPIAQKRAQLQALEPLVSDARTRADAAEILHRKFLAQRDEHNFLLAKKHAQPMAIEVLNETTRILPDDTWAHLLEIKSDVKNPAKNHEMHVRGETGISGKLISVFEESGLFTQATYKSPVTKGQPGAGDMFHVAAEIKKRSGPDAGVPAGALAPAAADTTEIKADSPSAQAAPPAIGPAVPAPAPSPSPVGGMISPPPRATP